MSVTGGPNGPTYHPDYTIESPSIVIFAAASSGRHSLALIGARDDLFVLDNRCASASTGAALLVYRWGSAANATPAARIAGARTLLTCP